jgi:hypothetical protein
MALALCKVEDVKLWIEGLHNTSKQDVLLAQIIAMVSDRIEQYCDREFEYSATITEYHDSDGNHDFIVVRRPPIATVTTLHDDPDRAFGSDALVAATDYTVYTNGTGIIQLKGCKFNEGCQGVKVVYAGGYTYQTLPASLKEACILQSVTLFKRREQADLVSVSGAGGSISKFEPLQLIEEVRQAIDPFVMYRPS